MAQTPRSKSLEELKQLLDHHHQWPGPYTFKFIVPDAHLSELLSLIADQPSAIRKSKNGAYSAVTWQMTVASSEAVLEIYRRVQSVHGLIAL